MADKKFIIIRDAKGFAAIKIIRDGVAVPAPAPVQAPTQTKKK